MKIAVYAIAKNESQFVYRFLDSAAAADVILIADTGSNDGTRDLAWRWANEPAIRVGDGNPKVFVHDVYISPWRFDVARNAALALIPSDIDVCIALDLDEVLQPGWREEIERVWKLGQTTRLRFGFDCGGGLTFRADRIHSRHGHRWHHPCHEYLVPDRIEEVWADSFAMLMEHKPDNSKSRGQYLDLLAASVREEPNDPRNCFYYARELGFHRKWTEAIEAYKKYLALPKSAWPHEVCYAMLVISRSYEELGNRSEALMWARRATAEAPHTREPWCALAMLAHHSARWAECFGATMSALAITNHEGFYTDDPASWGAQPHDLASIAAWHLGLHSIAVTQAEAAVELAPDDDRMKSNLEFYRRNAMIKDWSQ